LIHKGYVLSAQLNSLCTHDCVSTSESNIINKFADDTAIVGLVCHNKEEGYRKVIHLERWCRENNFLLNASKTKKLIVDYRRKQQSDIRPLYIGRCEVERMDSFKYLGVTITQDLSWSLHVNRTVKKARQRLFHLRRLRDFRADYQNDPT